MSERTNIMNAMTAALDQTTAGYNAVVLNQTATEFTENILFSSGLSFER
jgi:hypothetical protein